jgi:predicted branched-subunit amino acid permease
MVAGGSAHLAATASISVGASLVFTVATAWLVNARGLIYGAALGPHLRTQPRWFRWAAAYTLVDQIYALVSGVTARDDEYVRTYYLAAAALLWGAYMTGVGVGIVVGPVIPDAIPLSLAIPVMFTAMLVPALTDTPSWTAALVALTTALAGSTLPTGMGLVAGIVAGTVAGASVGGRDDV